MVHGSSGWGNLYRHKVRALSVPGTDGALPTVRFEMLREGLQDTEARIFLERALVNSETRQVLGEDLFAEVQALVATEWNVRNSQANEQFTAGTDWFDRLDRLYAVAALAQARLAKNK